MIIGEAIGARADWRMVDEGWGRRAVDFATLSEPGNAREYVAVQHRLGVDAGDRLLDVACGAGLAVALAELRGATCAGIDASHRLVAVARDRNPDADIRVGDMHALPWDDASFDVATSFRGIWGTTPAAVAEIHRVLVPGGRVGLTVWGHLKKSAGAWALAPFRLADSVQVGNQAAMVALGRPGAGEELLARSGFVDIERVGVPFVWEFADPETFARALANRTGTPGDPARRGGVLPGRGDRAGPRARPGRAAAARADRRGRLPRAHPGGDAMSGMGFLSAPEATASGQQLFDADVAEVGYVLNVSRMWAYQPATFTGIFDLLGDTAGAHGLDLRQRAILIAACASIQGDSYCSLAWGTRLAGATDAATAAGVLRGADDGLTPSEQAMATWARQVARDANGVGATDVEALRDAGYSDAGIFGITAFVALRIAFSTVNNALGACPDARLGANAPAAVREAVTWGRPVDAEEPEPAPACSAGPGSPRR